MADHDDSGRIAYIVCAYLHFPIVAGVILVGAGTQVAVEYPSEWIPLAGGALVASGIAAYLITLSVMTWLLRTPRSGRLAALRAVLLIVLALWLWLGRNRSAIAFLAGCALLLALHVVGNIRRGRQLSLGQPRSADR